MKEYTIGFRFNDVSYNADVLILRSDDFPVYLHIKNVKPAIPGLPDVCYLIYESSKKDFNLFVFNHSNELASKILEGVKKYCTENKIELSS